MRGESARGQSYPKARPKGVVDGNQVYIPEPPGEYETQRDASLRAEQEMAPKRQGPFILQKVSA